MKTPYCTAVTLQKREVDQIRLSIGAEANRLASVESARAALAEQLRHEHALASSDILLAPTRYFERSRAERGRLAEEQRDIDARLDQLRSVAREAYGSLQAVEGAAERFREDAARAAASAEQAAIDDRSATDLVRAARAMRSGGGRRG